MRYVFLFFMMVSIIGIVALIDSEFRYEHFQNIKKITAKSAREANRFPLIYQIDW